jgi:hypothetical protein
MSALASLSIQRGKGLSLFEAHLSLASLRIPGFALLPQLTGGFALLPQLTGGFALLPQPVSEAISDSCLILGHTPPLLEGRRSTAATLRGTLRCVEASLVTTATPPEQLSLIQRNNPC